MLMSRVHAATEGLVGVNDLAVAGSQVDVYNQCYYYHPRPWDCQWSVESLEATLMVKVCVAVEGHAGLNVPV